MSWRPHPKGAEVNPSFPRAWGTCDSCGFVLNHHKLQEQFQWAGTILQNTHFLVCERCLDVPNEALRTIVIPPDPPPIMNARVEQYDIDEGLMPLLTEPAYPGDPGSVIRTEDGKYIGVDPPS